MAQSDVSPDAAGAISASTLAYLFADRFSLSAEPYAPGQVVVSTELSGGLVAVALWHLRERGAVTLEAYSGKKLGFLPDNGVRVRFVSGVPTGGVEKKLLDYLQGSKRAREGRENARDLGNRLAMGGKDPRGAILSMAVDEAVEGGYLARPAGKGNAPAPQSERINTLAPAATELAGKWGEFREGDEAPLATLLHTTSVGGVAARVRNVQYA